MVTVGAARALAVLAATSWLFVAGCSVAEPPAAGVAGPRAVDARTGAATAGPAGRSERRSRPGPCRANHGQLVRVSLRLQHLWLCHGRHLVRDTPITSGMAGRYTRTPTGNFSIEGRDRNVVLTLNTGAQYRVNYWIAFQAPLYGFHDASWQQFPYGSPRYRRHGSHGCVHMPLRAIAFMYRWVHAGAKVRIRR